MNELLVAKAFLFVDDPYGDGIRLNHVRHPSPARIAAIDLVRNGQTSFDAMNLMLSERGEEIKDVMRTKSARDNMVRNSDVTEAEIVDLFKFLMSVDWTELRSAI